MCPRIIHFILFFDIFYFFATLIAGNDVVLSNEDKLEFSGDFAIHGEFPFIVHLGVQKKKKKVTCTGVILTNQWILTAAHCLHTGYYNVPVKDIRITAGVINYLHSYRSNSQRRNAKSFVLHPEYVPNRVAKFDVGLIMVTKPFDFNKFVSKIEILPTEWPRNESVRCVASGFGMIPGKKNTRLKKMNITAIHGETACPCTRRFQWKRLVCIKPQEGNGICQGDSGGPLICDGKVAGIVHMSMPLNTCSFIQYPKHESCLSAAVLVMYIYICPVMEWLHNYIPEAPLPPLSCKASINSTHVTVLLVFCIIFKMV